MQGEATEGDWSGLIGVRGQVTRLRNLSRFVLVLSLRNSTGEVHQRLQVVIKCPLLSVDCVSAAKRLIKLGDVLQVVGEMGAVELTASSWEVLERWAVKCKGQAFIPDQGPTSFSAEARSGKYCKTWANTGQCARGGKCPHRHGEDGVDWRLARKAWQAEHAALKAQLRQKARCADAPPGEVHENDAVEAGARSTRAKVFAAWTVDTFGAEQLAGGVLDVAGGRGDLTFELAATHNVPCTLLDPRPPAKLKKSQRLQLASSGAGAGHQGLRRVRASITPDGVGRPAVDAPKPHEGWQDVVEEEEALALFASCSVLVGLHPDQATVPIVSCAANARKAWACVPCCVFAADSPGRFLPGARPVATHEDLCDYLEELGNGAAKNEKERVQRARLNFKGKNAVLFQIFDKALI